MSYATEQGVLNAQWNAAQEAQITEQARRAPHVLMRPNIFPEGNAWCALYGENIQEGVCGFGETPEAAAADFDLAWRQQVRGPRGVMACERVQMPDKARAGIEALHYTVEQLLTTGRYVDEEGEATAAMADLLACIANPVFKPAHDVSPSDDAKALADAMNEIDRLNRVLTAIGDFAHDKSTGPAVPDALWEVRQMAYDAL